MTLKEAVEQSRAQLKPFKRPSWHYCLWFEDMLGHYTDGYNGMNCSGISIDEAIEEDYELVTVYPDPACLDDADYEAAQVKSPKKLSVRNSFGLFLADLKARLNS